ncbi:uncharacterized protein TNCV_4062261 [Trichonephila clavipes]|nr:uncharacterized protein TNCV_4062261 [Trichonephila clavipes]
MTWTTPELAPPLLTTTPHQREDVSALDRFNVHRCPTRRVFSGTGLEPVTKQATVRYLYHSATAARREGHNGHSFHPYDVRFQLPKRGQEGRVEFFIFVRGGKTTKACPTLRSGSDEARFWLNGYFNKQNCRIWSEANPQVYVETPLHPEKLTVWCALWAGGILLLKR